jgi:hypothetical protein
MLAAVIVSVSFWKQTVNVRASHTFDVSVKLSFDVEILQTPKQLSHDDSDILLSKYARLHLGFRVMLRHNSSPDVMAERTRSEHEPPEQYLHKLKTA